VGLMFRTDITGMRNIMNNSTLAQHLSDAVPSLSTGFDRVRHSRTVELPQRFDVHADIDLANPLSEPGTTLLIDGSNVAFADMVSLQSLVDARLRALDRGGELIVALPSDELRATLELTGFDSLVPVFVGGVQ